MFRKSRIIRIISMVAAVAALSSCGKNNPKILGGNAEPVRVKVMSASQVSADSSDAFSGTVEAGNSTTLSFSVAGTISKIYVSEGQRVSKGQLIASVDGASLKNAYEIAQATLREARDAYERMKKLHDAQALPDMQWVSVQQQLKQAEAAAAIAKKGMGDANIYAPISGVVSQKFADAGQTVAPGIPVVEILNVGSLKVKISVPESDLDKMKTGSMATVKAGTDGIHTYNAKLVEKGVAANTLSRNYDIKFQVLNPDDNLLPGMICSVSVDGVAPSSEGKGAIAEEIILPPQAVVLDWNNEHFVWVKKNGVAERKKVTTDGFDSRGIIISGGITPADSVIVEGQQKLSSGLKVVSVN